MTYKISNSHVGTNLPDYRITPGDVYTIDPDAVVEAIHAENDTNHTPDTQRKKIPDIDMDSLLKIALLASVNLPTLRNSIHSMFGIMLSIKELKEAQTFNQLLDEIKSKQINTKSM